MDKKDIRILTELAVNFAEVRTEEELAKVIESAAEEFECDDIGELKVALYRLGGRMLCVDAADRDAVRNRRLACLTDEEKKELKLVEEIIDGNLLKYHFQPIVSAVNGEIFSYEALMRSAGDPKMTPFHILKYAALKDRLEDVERATFLNVLGLIEQKKDELCGRSVFINSIPDVRLCEEDVAKISELLKKHSDCTVVELTESAEADEGQLTVLKDRYGSLNVRIAVDDYGTGYSNVSNLLRYTPNFVKIDRSLLSEINIDPKKRHFVRDIIEFCHDNNILALAEGVETSMELKTVILMGVDLIQGFYTARPSAELTADIPYEIKQEIRRYQQQRIDGKETHVYKVEGTERVLLEKLKKHGYRCLRIMPSEQAGDITLVGEPSLDSRVNIEIDDGYKGKLSLENAHLANSKNRPCICLGENCEVELSIYGDCKLKDGGILVPESSELTFTGIGALEIDINTSSYYGIGGHRNMRHGRLSFSADVEYSITAYGESGTCIGSGLGGEIDIHRGVFHLLVNSNSGVAIGALTGSTDLDIRNCGIDLNVTIAQGVMIGSRDGDAELKLHGMSFKTITGGKEVACIGSLNGRSNIELFNSNYVADVRSDSMTVFGSLWNDSKVDIRNLSMNVMAAGQRAYVFGGLAGRTQLEMNNTDSQIKLNTQLDGITSAKGDDLRFGDGRYRIYFNDEEISVTPDT
ncbi:MAG: EAL domain-containing protein [Ruminococcus sp.]|uniref:EAL domain-containing protein n=1 Tax=Ruminococcus sp. TaxID=41978 RepID=UPI0025F3B6C1|nr:EAL domain-containing protein [Ruminococcus sp.]MBR0529866.1 EAL domain-containing protein [Ruminococcus sp.]